MTYLPDPAFDGLYRAYTAQPDSIGAHLNGCLSASHAADPLLVTTGSDIVIFPGSGRPPVRESFRLSTRGFVEITAISHLGVAVPYLARLRELGFEGWREDARRLIEQAHRVRRVNTLVYWRDMVAVAAWRGLEQKIVDLTDYSCAVTIDILRRGLEHPEILSLDYLREHFLDSGDARSLPVSMNDMMAATFALVFLDTGYRIIDWLRRQSIDWSRAMALVTGRAGRPTAGLTWHSNSMCNLLWRASEQRLEPERLYIAPHAPALQLADLDTEASAAELEARYRQIWFSSRTPVEMARLMYQGYPGFRRDVTATPVLDAATDTLSEIPTVRSAEDRRAIVTRMRFVMEDPGQQLANAGAQFIVDQLCANGNRPEAVVVPGFTDTVYPKMPI